MRRLLCFFLFSPLALAQLTQVSGTVKDPTGLPYSLGTITATLVISGSPRFTFNSLPYTPPSQPVGLDTNGSFVMSLGDVNQLTPSGGTWSFHVCSAQGTVQPGSPITAGPVCFDAPGFIISGTSVNISTQLSAASARLTTGGAGGSVTVTPGTTGQFAIYSNPTTVSGTPVLTTNGTLITATVPITCANNVQCLVSGGSNGGFGFGTGGTAQVFGSGGIIGQLLALRVNNTPVSTGVSTPAANLNLTTPAAPTNGINVTWQAVNGTNPASISAALVGDGTTNFLNGQGVYTNSIPSLSLTSTGTALTTAGSISSTTAGSTVTSAAGQTAIGFATTTGASPALVVSYNGGAPRVLPTININGTVVPVLSQASSGLNFNNVSPAAPTNGKNVAFQVSGTQITAALVGDGVSTNCFLGTGTFGPCAGTTPPQICTILDIPLSSTGATLCTFTLPAIANSWTLDCKFMFAVPTNPTSVNIAVTPQQAPSSPSNILAMLYVQPTAGSGPPSPAILAVQSQPLAAAGQLLLFSPAPSITIASVPQPLTLSGTFNSPAVAGTFLVQGFATAGTAVSGGFCKLQ